MKLPVLVSLLLTLVCTAAKKPNIIYILADDLGYGDLGCYGQKTIQTPRLDQMAADGIRFTQHYSGSTVCGPSRSCMLTGKHTGHSYVRGNGKLQMRLDPHDEIFPKALQQAGYHTAMIGKSGLGCNTDDSTLPNAKGFDYFFGYTSHTEAHHYFPKYLWRNAKKINYPNNTLQPGQGPVRTNQRGPTKPRDRFRVTQNNRRSPHTLGTQKLPPRHRKTRWQHKTSSKET